jgi:putative zinc finger/helix-turn-helix YgiT family protein
MPPPSSVSFRAAVAAASTRAPNGSHPRPRGSAQLPSGLLTADEIRSLRERFGVTQAELARLLRLGQNTLSRWEAGRNVQTAAMDVLLRVLRDVPGGLEYLRKHAA